MIYYLLKDDKNNILPTPNTTMKPINLGSDPTMKPTPHTTQRLTPHTTPNTTPHTPHTTHEQQNKAESCKDNDDNWRHNCTRQIPYPTTSNNKKAKNKISPGPFIAHFDQSSDVSKNIEDLSLLKSILINNAYKNGKKHLVIFIGIDGNKYKMIKAVVTTSGGNTDSYTYTIDDDCDYVAFKYVDKRNVNLTDVNSVYEIWKNTKEECVYKYKVKDISYSLNDNSYLVNNFCNISNNKPSYCISTPTTTPIPMAQVTVGEYIGEFVSGYSHEGKNDPLKSIIVNEHNKDPYIIFVGYGTDPTSSKLNIKMIQAIVTAAENNKFIINDLKYQKRKLLTVEKYLTDADSVYKAWEDSTNSSANWKIDNIKKRNI